MIMSNDMIKLIASNDDKSSTLGNSFSKLTTTTLVHDNKIQSLISSSMVQNYQSMEPQCNVNFKLPMALVNEMETDSAEIITQKDS